MEHKTSPAFVTKTDDELGIVETVFAVFGNLDKGNDIIHPGAFTTTFVQNGLKVKILDHHNRDSVLDVLGKPKAFRELSRDELPMDLLKEYPEATGGAWAQVQFNMKTQAGHDVFQHFRAGDIDEWSFGYDALDKDYTEIDKIQVRNLRTIKLYELSPVIWGMNPATTTTSAKEEKPAPEETENTIRIRVRDPGDFQEDSFRTISIDKDRGIQAVIGRLEGETTTTVQAYIFNKEKGDWTVASAQEWVDEHKKSGKAINLSEQVESIRAAFSNQYNLPNGPWDYWVNTVYDEYIIIQYDGEDGLEWYQVLYTIVDDKPEFAPRGEWIRGNYTFVPVGKAAGPDDDTIHPPKGTGPGGAPSTSEDLLRIIKIKQKQLTLLEV
jgi:HK97 family phage prohead protease